MASRASILAGGACVAALGLASVLAFEDLRRGPDESVDKDALKLEAAVPAAPAAAAPAALTPEQAAQARASQQHYLAGVVFFQKGDAENARAEMTLSLQLDPTNAEAKAALDRLASPAAAEAAPVQASASDASSSRREYFAGVLSFQKGDFEAARRAWTRALALDPSNADARKGLTRLPAQGTRP